MAELRLGIDAGAARRGAREFNRSADSIQRNARSTTRSVGRMDGAFKRVTSSVFSLKSATTALASAAGLGYLIKRTAAAAGETQRLAGMAGIAAGEFSAMSAVGQRAGVNMDAMSDAIKELQIRSSEFVEEGAGEAAESFDSLFGEDARRKVRSMQQDTGQFFRGTLEMISEVENKSRRIRLLDELFGGQGGEQLALLLQRVDQAGGDFSDTLREMEQAARDSGRAMSGEQIQSLTTLNRELDAAGRTIRTSFASAIADNRESIQGFVDLLAEGAEAAVDFAGAIGDMAGASELGRVQNQIGRVTNQLEQLRDIQQKAEDQSFLDALNPMANAFDNSILEKLQRDGESLDETIQRLSGTLRLLQRREFRLIDATDDAGDSLDNAGNSADNAGNSVRDLGSDLRFTADEAKKTQDVFDRLFTNPRDANMGVSDRMRDRNITSAEDVLFGRDSAETEAMRNASAMMDKLDRQMEDMQQGSRDLGLAFSSAFEDAVIEGENLRGVLKGLLEDITRIMVRRNATEPMADAISGIDWGSLIGGAFSGTTSSMGTGTGSSPAIASSADGNMFTSPSVTSIAERGQPEAVLPLERQGGKLGVRSSGGGGGDVYQIDARGADQAAVARLERTIKAVNGSIERRAVNAVGSNRQRSFRG